MNCFSLALRSVIRKPVKSILLFVAVFIISLLLLSGMGSGKASIVMQDNTRQAMGAGLLLEENEADRHRRIEELSGQLDHKEGSLGGYHQEKLTINGRFTWQRERSITVRSPTTGKRRFSLLTGLTPAFTGISSTTGVWR